MGLGPPYEGPLGYNTPVNTRGLLALIEKAMSHPDWEMTRRHLMQGRGGIRQFRSLLVTPIVESLQHLSVVLAAKTTRIVGIFSRATGGV